MKVNLTNGEISQQSTTARKPAPIAAVSFLWSRAEQKDLA